MVIPCTGDQRLSGSLYLVACRLCPVLQRIAPVVRKHYVLYAHALCGHCQHQKTAFGAAVDALDIVHCADDKDKPRCEEAHITGCALWAAGQQGSGKRGQWGGGRKGPRASGKSTTGAGLQAPCLLAPPNFGVAVRTRCAGGWGQR